MWNNLAAEAASLLGGAAPQDVAAATSDHVASTDPDTLASHLTDGTQNLDQGGLAQLAQSLLGALAKNGHDETQAQDAGVDTEAAAAGDQQNVVALIEHARDNPAALRDAAVDFAKSNPQLLSQMPGLLEGVLGRLRG